MAFVLGFIMLNFTTVKVDPIKTAAAKETVKEEKQGCPYGVSNGLMCPVKVDITVYKRSATGCNVVCVFLPGITINPGQLFMIPCAGCQLCNIVVNVVNIGGIPPTTSSPADFSTLAPNPLAGGGCPSTGIVYSPGSIPGGGAFKIF